MNVVRVVVAVVLAIAFAVFAVFLVLNAGTQNVTEWERWIYVFGAAEALAFTAVGWLFGREVNRKRAEIAEIRANDAEQQKATAKQQGAALAGMIVAGASQGTRTRLEALGAGRSADYAFSSISRRMFLSATLLLKPYSRRYPSRDDISAFPSCRTSRNDLG